jgi:hypothetical protein
MNAELRRAQHMETLSRLLIRAHCDNKQATRPADLAQLRHDLRYVSALSAQQLADFLALADAHHVIVRALTLVHNAAVRENEKRIAEWCDSTLAAECARIEQAVAILQSICNVLELRGCKVAVIKSLDHWPDLGSDLDLYTTADDRYFEQVMREEFRAHPVARSWGDRLASKWNYRVPGLPELVEVHVQYLGQTGEHAEMARRVIARRVLKTLGGRDFRVPAAEERIVISSLQRVYRHFYFRLCDMVDIASLLQTETVHFSELKRAANCAGIWPGVATFLCLIQNYIHLYGGVLPLPDEVMASAHSRESNVRFKGGFLRVSKTTAAGLYGSQLLQAGLRGDVRALLRLPLLPPLAVSALVAHSLTGNDRGIW